MGIHNEPQRIAELYDARVGSGATAPLARRDGLFFDHSGVVLDYRWPEVRGSAELGDDGLLGLLYELEKDLVGFASISLAAIPPAGRVLDAGSGRGGAAIMIHERHGCHVEGVTLSREEAKFASRAAEARGVRETVRFAVNDMIAYCHKAGPFAAIWCLESTEHIDDLKLLLATFAAATAPGARVVIIAWCVGSAREAQRLKPKFDERYATNVHRRRDYLAAARGAGLTIVNEANLSSWTRPYWQLRARSSRATGSEAFVAPALLARRLTYRLFVLKR